MTKLFLFSFFLFFLNAIFTTSSFANFPNLTYQQAQELISNKKNTEAIRFIKKEILSTPFNSKTTNGYPIVFFYQKLLADAYSANNNPVDSINTYREALSYVPLNIITSSPVHYAKAMHGLAKQFMSLRRWADAEEILSCILYLVKNKKVLADIHWCRCNRASFINDMKTVMIEANKCIDIAPFYNSEVYHYAALSEYVLKSPSESIDTWLSCLNAFVYTLPTEEIPDFLNNALPYWKNISEEQVLTFYNTLESIITANPVNENNLKAISRILCERLKLEKLYPELCNEENAVALLKDAVLLNEFSSDEFIPLTNPACYLQPALIEINEYETLINHGLSAVQKSEYKSAKNYFKKVLENIELIKDSHIKINGYNLEYFVMSQIVQLPERNLSNKQIKKLLRYCERAIKLVKKDKAGNVSNYLEDFFALLFAKACSEGQLNKLEEMLETLHWANELFPESLRVKSLLLAKEIIIAQQQNNMQVIYATLEKLLALPSQNPYIYFWELQEKLLRMKSLTLTETQKKQNRDLIINNAFSGLEKALINFRKKSNNLKVLPLFSTLLKYEKQGNLKKENYKHIYSWIQRIGVTIPAKLYCAPFIADTIKWHDYFSSVERDYPITLNIICNAKPWGNNDNVILWSDILKEPIFMTKDENLKDIWFASLTIPENEFLVQYQFYKKIEDVPETHKPEDIRKVFLVDNEHKEMTIKETVNREKPVWIIAECDVKATKSFKNLYFIKFVNNSFKNQKSFRMRDKGKRGDKCAKDKIYSCIFKVSPDIKSIKYTFAADSGNKKEWGDDDKKFWLREFKIPNYYVGTNRLFHYFGKPGAIK